MHTGHVDALLVLDFAVVQHSADDVGIVHGLDLQFDQAVIQHDGAAGGHVLRQILIGDGADLLGALHIAGGQGEGLAGFQHLGAVLEVLQADLRAFGVQQSSHGLAQLLAQGLEQVQTALVLLVGAVGEVEAGNIHAVGDQFTQDAVLVGGRAQGADNFRFSHSKYLRLRSHSLIYFAAGCLLSCRTARAHDQQGKLPVLWVGMYGKVKIQNFTNYYYNRFLTREQVEFQDEYNFFAYREV